MIKQLGSIKVYLHDSPKTLTAERHKDFNVYLSHEKDIGSDLESIKKRASEALMYFNNDSKAAKAAIMNIYFTIDAMKKGISFSGRAFALLVEKLVIEKDELIPDASESGLDETIKLLSEHGLTQEMVESWTEELKKKSTPS